MPTRTYLDPDKRPSAEIEQAVLQGLSIGNYAIIVTDHTKIDEPVVYANHAFEELTGYNLAEIVGLHPHFMISDRNQAGVKELEAAVKAGRPCSAILSNFQKDEKTIWYQVAITPVVNQSGLLTHFFGTVKDVTSLLTAASITETSETFIAALAHDLKSALTGASKLFTLILDGSFGIAETELQKTLGLLSNNNDKALNLVMNVLESYRLNKGVQVMNFSPLNLTTLIEKTVQEVESSADAQHSKIQIIDSPILPLCVFDKQAISRLLTNLLENAVKFSPNGGLIQISAESHDGEIVLKISDSGKGIAPDDKDLVFEKCKRGKGQQYMPGCGLGLYICREIAKIHQGQISYESQLDIGTTFTVTLPIVQAANAGVTGPSLA